jgi:acyl dehydratase
VNAPTFDVGDLVGPERRRCPTAERVRAYAARHDTREALFIDPTFAARLGYRDVIVPGPMQTAFLEQLLRRHFRGWCLEQLGTTFRISVITNDTITLRGVVTEVYHQPDGIRVVCDLLIENGDGERATTGQATLRQAVAQ